MGAILIASANACEGSKDGEIFSNFDTVKTHLFHYMIYGGDIMITRKVDSLHMWIIFYLASIVSGIFNGQDAMIEPEKELKLILFLEESLIASIFALNPSAGTTPLTTGNEI